MSDAVHIEQGAYPWLPTRETVPGVILHRFTIPLAGLITQDGVQFLYWCVTGHAASENAWAYAQVDTSEVQKLEAADSATFDEILHDVVGEKACTFAVASDDKGIIESVVLNPPANFDNVHERGMAEMGAKFREMFKEYRILQERFPLLHSAANFDLVPTPQVPQEAV